MSMIVERVNFIYFTLFDTLITVYLHLARYIFIITRSSLEMFESFKK